MAGRQADAGRPDVVIVGNVARDIAPDPPGWRPGGAAVYAATVAHGLGRRVGVVTAATEDVVRAGLPMAMVARFPAEESVSFDNRYADGHRTQVLCAAGQAIPPETVPVAWQAAPVVLLGAVYHEISAALARRFTGRVGICAQGFLRRADTGGRIRPLPPEEWDAALLLTGAYALFCSEEDLGGAAPPAWWMQQVPVVAVTRGRHGAWLFVNGERRHLPTAPAHEVDPTGAGDAFAGAFLIAVDEGADPWQAGRFAAATAAITVEHRGPYGPARAEVQARLAATEAG